MLQTIHDKAKGWVAYAIVGLITIPFALFGIEQYIGGGGKLAAAVVNGEEISVEQVQNTLREMKQQFGGQLPPGMDDTALKTAALDSVINQVLIQQKIRDGGYRASDRNVADAIAAIEVFQKDGKFDQQTYDNFLKMQRRDPVSFEAQVRADLTEQQLRDAAVATAFIPKTEMERYESLRNQQRELEVFTLKMTDFQTQAQVGDQQIADYYAQNKAAFMTEEKVQIAYLELKRDDLAAKLTLDDAALQQWFEDNAERYAKPEERTVSHILVSVDDPAKDAEAKQRIDALYADIQAGKRTFEDVAKTDSDDKNTADNGGSLGAIVLADWGPEFTKAVTALAAGQMSEPVKTEAGYEIIRVIEIKPAVAQEFVTVKAAVEKDYRTEQADKAFVDAADKMQTLAYENDGDLASIATALNLNVQQSDWATQSQGQGIVADEKVRNAAFAEEVLKSGKNSEALELADGHVVVLRVINHEAAAQKPLESVQADIRSQLLAQASRQLTAQKGEAVLTKLSATQTWSVLTDEGIGDESGVEKLGLVTRTDSKLSPEIAQKAFAMNAPVEGKSSWAGIVLGTGDYVVINLKAVKTGDATAADATSNRLYGQSLGMRELSAMLESLRESAEIETHPENL
jgi:peptidyl-prolyl cis-trans isomerase D